MFGRMNGALLAQNFLRARNAEIVSPPIAEVSESGTVFGAGQCGHPCAACAAMKIQTQPRTPSAQRSNGGRQDFIYIGTIFKYSAKAIFYYDRDV
jgi:hypothetical protein